LDRSCKLRPPKTPSARLDPVERGEEIFITRHGGGRSLGASTRCLEYLGEMTMINPTMVAVVIAAKALGALAVAKARARDTHRPHVTYAIGAFTDRSQAR
jgi:hypothetical protein